MAVTAVTSMTSVLPTQADRIPACSARREGKLAKKSHDRRCAPSRTIPAKSVTNVSTPTIRAKIPTIPNIRSHRLCLMISERICATVMSAMSVDLPVTSLHEMTNHVEEQRQQHQTQSSREDSLVADAAMRKIAQRNLHDIGRNGRRRLCRIPGEIRLHACSNGYDHGFADCARDTEYVRRCNAREGSRRDNADRGLEARGAHGIGALSHRHRDRTHRIFRNRTDVRNDHDP